jgi:ABC-type enterochelin transport system permease subunit
MVWVFDELGMHVKSVEYVIKFPVLHVKESGQKTTGSMDFAFWNRASLVFIAGVVAIQQAVSTDCFQTCPFITIYRFPC